MSVSPPAAYPSSVRAWAMVGVLMLAYVLSFIDRQILGLLVEPISRDLQLSDTEFSYLQGLSFALFYTVCGIPIARLADTRSRRRIVAGGVGLWSLMTAVCGLARHYPQLLLARMGVGVGEATLSPSAYSLIVDSFPPARRATALGTYTMGIYLGSGLAFGFGGAAIAYMTAQGNLQLPLLGSLRPWQSVFLLLGALGLPVTVLILLIREPARIGAGAGQALPWGAAGRWLAGNRATLALMYLGFALMSFASYGAGAWAPSVFIRVHGWSPAQTGLVYGAAIGVFGAAGSLFGGRCSDALLRRGHADATLRVALAGAIGAMPFTLAWPLVGSPVLAAALMAPALFFIAMPFGVAPAAIQAIAPAGLRSQASALYLFVVNLIGLGLGPTAVALLTDRVFHDRKAVGDSLLIVSIVAETAAVLLLYRALAPYRRSLSQRPTAATADLP